MAEHSQETEAQQVSVLAPQEHSLAPAVELGDEMEVQPVGTCTSSPPGVSSPIGTEQKEDDAQERVELEENKLEQSEHGLPLSRQVLSIHLQEEASPSVSETIPSVNQCQEDLPEEVCNSHHEAVDVSISPNPADKNMGMDQETVFAAYTNSIQTVTESKTDEGVNDADAIKSDSGEFSELLEPDESQSLQEIVPIEVGRSPENHPEIEDTDNTIKDADNTIKDADDTIKDTDNTMEDSCSPQAVKEPEVDPLGGEDQCPQNHVTEEQNPSSHELSVGEPQPVCENQTAVEEDVKASSSENQDPVVPTAVTPESITAALISDDTSSSQDFIKDDTLQAKPLATLDATTDASGRSTPNIEVLKDLTGRDSPSIRPLKEDSGRDSPSQRSRRRIGRDSVVTEANEANMGIFPAENLFEYQWPEEKGSEWYFVQEQVSEFLQVKSFKRKYPDLERRVMDISEKDFLRERGVVTEEQVTLGLTALRADEVYDLMLKDAPDKSAEYARVLHEKEKQNISNKHKQYEAPSVDSNKVQEYVKKAVRQAAEYNSALMAERREERQYYFDMQTLTVQMPASRMKRHDKEITKLGPYPVAVIPGQYQNYYRSYSSDELKYFPLNTSLYGPMAPRRQTDLGPPLSNDEPDQSDNETVLSTENFDSSSDVSDRDQPTPMDMDSHGNVELDAGDDRTANITLPNDSSCVYKPVAVRELEPCVVVGLERPKDIPNAICGLCLKNSSENKMGVPEKMIHCSQCDNSGHPSCLDMTLSMVEVIQTYPWQCMECKTCFHCGDPTHEDKMMFCDMCDRGYHTFCVGLQDIPTGLWACESCQMRDVPAALAPHVPTPPLPPTPPPAEPSLGEEPPSPQPAESTPSNKKKGRRSATPVSVTKQSTPGGKRSKTSTPTPKRVKKK